VFTKKSMALEEAWLRTGRAFRSEILLIAAEHGTTWQEVYAAWREYAEWCSCGDQSPVMPEFSQLYRDKLKA
jgi:flavorubredoxin